MLWKLVRLIRELLSSIEKLLGPLIIASVIFLSTKQGGSLHSTLLDRSKHKTNVNPVLALTSPTQVDVGAFVKGNLVGLTVGFDMTSFCRISNV